MRMVYCTSKVFFFTSICFTYYHYSTLDYIQEFYSKTYRRMVHWIYVIEHFRITCQICYLVIYIYIYIYILKIFFFEEFAPTICYFMTNLRFLIRYKKKLTVSSSPIAMSSHFYTLDRHPLYCFDLKKDFVFIKVRFEFLLVICFVLVDFLKDG